MLDLLEKRLDVSTIEVEEVKELWWSDDFNNLYLEIKTSDDSHETVKIPEEKHNMIMTCMLDFIQAKQKSEQNDG